MSGSQECHTELCHLHHPPLLVRVPCLVQRPGESSRVNVFRPLTYYLGTYCHDDAKVGGCRLVRSHPPKAACYPVEVVRDQCLMGRICEKSQSHTPYLQVGALPRPLHSPAARVGRDGTSVLSHFPELATSNFLPLARIPSENAGRQAPSRRHSPRTHQVLRPRQKGLLLYA
jgi:hypothetical protein